jgi:hypothetical protein
VLTPRDRAFLVCFGNHLRLVSDFSPPDPELGPAEERVLGTAFYDAIFYGVTEKLVQSESGRLTARNKYGTAVMDRPARETGGAHFDAEKVDVRAKTGYFAR